MPVVIEGEDYNEIYTYFHNIGIERNQIRMLNAELAGIDYHTDNTSLMRNKLDYQTVALIETANKMDEILNSKLTIPPKWHHSGTCIPGVKRLFVDVNGVFYPCEKILLRNNLSIGDLKSGFNIERIKSMSNIGKLSEERCKHCWAMRFCEICVSQCNDIEKNKITAEQKMITCDAQEKKSLWYLKDKILRINRVGI